MIADTGGVAGAVIAAIVIKRRIDEASRHVDLDRLCLSPQCGFASGYTTNRLSLEDQERKLGQMASIAREIWG
jgi:5-methyltetrahydropteroyltriglutamate--homocysteine methyltransferase